MKKGLPILLLALLLISCSESRKPHPSIVDNDRVEELYDRTKADSVCEEILEKAKEEVELENQSSINSVTSSSRPHSTSSRVKYDNMRGFDPASEDDMDDNGMSRYMENNDEEGWD